MLSTLNLFPTDFQKRDLLQVIAPILDKYTSEEKNKIIIVERTDKDSEYIEFEYITQVNAVYTYSTIYILDTDYTIELKDNRSIINWIGDSPDEGTKYLLDINYYDTCIPQNYEISEPLLFKLLTNYEDASAALAYFKTMIQPSVGTLYCINNLISMIQVNATVEEWFETSTITPFHFNINIPTIPSIFDINTFIDYVLLLKNERSHLERVGQNICGTAHVWDYFTYSDGLWDDIGGVVYRGVKICLIDIFRQHLFDDLPEDNSAFTFVDGQFEFYSVSLNTWLGPWVGDWDKLQDIETTRDFYYPLVINGDMELDSNWYDYIRYTELYPSDLLFPSDTLYPGGGLSSVTLNERSTLQVFEGIYSRRFKAILYGGIKSETFTTTTTDINYQVRAYPIDGDAILGANITVAFVKESDSSVVYEKEYSELDLSVWHLLGENINIPIDTYRIAIFNSWIVDFSDTTEYEHFIDSVIVKGEKVI